MNFVRRPPPENVVEWSRPIELGGVVVLRGTNCTRGFEVFHDTFDICAMQAGACDYVYRGRTHSGNTDALQLFEPGETHSTPRVYVPGNLRVLHIPTRLVEEHSRELGGTSRGLHWNRFAHRGPVVFAALKRLHRSLESPSAALERQSRFSACLEVLLREASEKPPPPRTGAHEPAALRATRDYLLSHLEDDVTLEDLASVARLSRFHLLRVFRSRFGVPPHAFLIRARLSKARRMLDAGEAPASVALATGFFDQSHLTRYFKLAWRVSPGEYVRQTRGRTAIRS